MKAIARNPRQSALKTSRVHFVSLQADGTYATKLVAVCGLAGNNGWREVTARPVDCPKCLRRMTASLADEGRGDDQ